MSLKNYEMSVIGKYWTPEQGKEYIIEIIGNEYKQETFKQNDGREEVKDVMVYKISALQEIGSNYVSTFETPKEWKTASQKVHRIIQQIINDTIREGKENIRIQLRRDTDNKYTVFKWTMPKF